MISKRPPYDKVLYTVSLVLVLLGIIMVYSAGAIKAGEQYGDPFFFLKKQLLWALIGCAVMIWAMNRDYRTFQQYAPLLFFFSLFLLLLVLVPSIGVKVNNARRWIRLFGISFQPSELAKLSIVLLMARVLAKRADQDESFMKRFFLPLILSGLVCGLIVLQPHFGMVGVLLCTVLALCFAAGVRLSHLSVIALAVGAVAVLFVVTHPYALERVMTALDPTHASAKAAHQTNQSIVALGPGGLLGRGLGESYGKLGYLPESHTEFIFAVAGEETGLIGSLIIVSLFGVFLWRGTRIALRAPDLFGAYAAIGITFIIVVQAVINLGVVVGLLPITGLPLPLVSFGGTSLVTTLFCVGILLSISRYQTARGRLA
ncbi:essential cell division protein (stabilizes FtsZ ring) [Candidatus Methylomirabilis lanthanidiphila]|uniref:Probable peptidoglycan glycosyltransferase FtsW n=1 Tax=Candidatus Methylomirabilis lanthanidiphila TaxID=2211376 RepID=A0A564ZFR9_9BACT|nr:putative lipid II flippase FtsW [Candidatus Methylomirabilis lanthanidiphila]VUZ84155.1 essential cell division protein (stabilizes FtsZ ring) [Candidatus Methylomirabilis lanthanidiphila]